MRPRHDIASRLLPTCALEVPILGKPEIGWPPSSFETHSCKSIDLHECSQDEGGTSTSTPYPPACAFSRIALSDIAGVSASGSILRWMIAGLPDFCAASKAGMKSAVFSTVAP